MLESYLNILENSSLGTYSIPDESQFAGLEITRVPEAWPPKARFGLQPVRLVAGHAVLFRYEAAVVEENHDLARVVCASSCWVEAIELCLYRLHHDCFFVWR
jgi:hypothetical protein